ncbi:hypothetical protein [Streptomyces sp. NPDC059262]|uniref:hypothetical protein n=1 Tax=Streptomyces sp. NPDC059262 TaxID=3346797 RepID=UPI0036A41463
MVTTPTAAWSGSRTRGPARASLRTRPGRPPAHVTADNWAESYTYDSAGNRVTAAWPQRAGRAEGRDERT